MQTFSAPGFDKARQPLQHVQVGQGRVVDGCVDHKYGEPTDFLPHSDNASQWRLSRRNTTALGLPISTLLAAVLVHRIGRCVAQLMRALSIWGSPQIV